MNTRPWTKRWWFTLCQSVCRIYFLVFHGVRVRGHGAFPATGGVLLVSNHQSHYDPVLAGITCTRQSISLARETLFHVPILRPLIESFDAIRLDREGTGLAGLKETLRWLKRGEVVLLFPEGTRTPDGRLGPLKPGFCAVARRTGVPIVPMAVAGAFDAWPRSRTFPRLATIHVDYAQPISPAEIAALDDQQLIAEVRARLAACLARAEAGRRWRQIDC
jgi:1-acyl-sn-glycerol-3-phosphate acyltransferase